MSSMQELIDISREIGQQQTVNGYYRECYAAFKLLQEITANLILEIDELFESQDSRSMASIQRKFSDIQETTLRLADRACRAQKTCEELCPVDVSSSARNLLEPIVRLIKDRNHPATNGSVV